MAGAASQAADAAHAAAAAATAATRAAHAHAEAQAQAHASVGDINDADTSRVLEAVPDADAFETGSMTRGRAMGSTVETTTATTCTTFVDAQVPAGAIATKDNGSEDKCELTAVTPAPILSAAAAAAAAAASAAKEAAAAALDASALHRCWPTLNIECNCGYLW